jgi:hypothetical protein
MKNSDYTYDYLLQSFEQAKERATELVHSVDEERFLRKPAEDKWCMGEILNHLTQAGNEYLPQIKKGLNKPDENLSKGNGPFTPSFVMRWFIGQVSPENRRKLPTVAAFQPVEVPEINPTEVLNGFLKLQDEIIHILKKAKLEQLDLDHIKTRNPVVKFIPMSLTSCFAIQEAHQRRHFEQMRELKEKISE